MKKNTYKFLGYTCLVGILILILINKNILNISESYIDNYHHEEYGEDYEESEEEIAYEMAMDKESLPKAFDLTNISNEELDKYNSWLEKVKQSNFKFSTSEDFSAYFENAKKNMTSAITEQYSYANNTLTGVWDQKHLHMSSTTNPGYSEGGFRTDGSLYDPVNEEMYIVSFAGHIYKIDENASIKWKLRNQTKSFEGDKFNGVNLADGTFRMLNQKGTGGMEFSDDEGRTWMNANGAFFESNANYTTLVTKKGTSKRIVAHGAKRNSSDANAWYDYVYISTDYGLNYTTSALTFKSSAFDVEILKPHSSRAIYLFAKRNSDSKLFVYKMGENDSDFNLIHQPTTTEIKSLDAVNGTTVNGKTHFYISYNNTDIFYSADEGATWSKKVTTSNTGRNITEVHPTKPNMVFKGFVELWISTDYGVNWTRNQHVLSNNDIYVWDLQHFKTFDKEDGGSLTISGYDFGTYYSTTPEDWNSWVSVSKGNPTTMCYDADTSEKHNRIYTANQDRGSQSYIDDPNHDITKPIPTIREANTDVLRVTIAKDGESAWYWYYYGSIGRSSVTDGGNFRTVIKKNLFPNWAATSMVPSPISTEDAVFIPWGTQLQKITYNGSTVENTLHSYVFPEAAHSFGYSNLNKNRWYVGLQSGKFMYSIDGGSSFSNSSYNGSWPIGENSHRKRRAVIATSPIDEATVYYAGKGNSFLISVDGGKTFTNHNNGLTVDRIVDLEASPNGQFIFAACEFDGSWVYSVQQDKWFKMDGKAVPEAVGFTDVQFIESTNVVRFATYGSGIIDFTLNEDFSTIFVAADNFEIQVTDETCQGKNGQLKINTKYNHNYTVIVGGIDYSFTNTLTIPNLEPGDYDICIEIANTSYQHCATLKIEGSSLLSGNTSNKANSKILDVQINSGTAPFTVYVNHKKVLETLDTSFSVKAQDGDLVEIASKAICEGKITKIMGSLELKALPNPTTDYVEINLPPKSGKTIKVDLFSSSSQLIFSKQYSIVNNKIRINLKDNPSGMYFIRLHLEKLKTIKILKQ